MKKIWHGHFPERGVCVLDHKRYFWNFAWWEYCILHVHSNPFCWPWPNSKATAMLARFELAFSRRNVADSMELFFSFVYLVDARVDRTDRILLIVFLYFLVWMRVDWRFRSFLSFVSVSSVCYLHEEGVYLKHLRMFQLIKILVHFHLLWVWILFLERTCHFCFVSPYSVCVSNRPTCNVSQ